MIKTTPYVKILCGLATGFFILTLFFTQCVYGQMPSVSAVSGGLQRLAFSMEVVSNTFDGSVLSECQTQDEITSGKKHEIWISFGRVKPLGERGWEAAASIIRCGGGLFDQWSTLLGRSLGIPYIVINIVTIPSVNPGRKADLQITLQIRKLSAFDERGKPVYMRSEQKRTFYLGPEIENDLVVPILVADQREIDAFNVHELFIRFEARVLGQEVAAYGNISVTADVPGIDILLDGGLVGRIPEKGAIDLRNIRVGKHEVSIRDLSGRMKREQVIVKKNRTVEVDLKLLNLPSSPVPANLSPLGKNPQGYEEYWRALDGTVVVKVPAGEFLMGSAEGEGDPSEHPQHRVFITEFLMDKTEVTWRQLRKFVEATGTPLPPEPPWGTPGDYAVSNVLFNEAKAYCEWVGGRLPTEAEWEKAARGVDGRKYPWGNEWDPDRCNSFDGGPHRPRSVGSFPDCLSPYGILDMAGGVWEWCADWYTDVYLDESARDLKGPETGTQRVVRGASWLDRSTWLRAAYRHKSDPLWRNTLQGFRCIQEIPQ
jgi:formylglycine-generating enzyme required for sulfatase activity